MKFLKLVITIVYLISAFLLTNCEERKEKIKTIEDVILKDTSSFYFVDVKNYPQKDKKLPIGMFDSGTGGLTVLDAVVNFDGYDNQTHNIDYDGDGIRDFQHEYFIYLGDQANMPYGNYPSVGKIDLLKEHILKDVQFLLSNKYYLNSSDEKYQTDKNPVKAIVIACNTATAYGKEDIENFLKRANLDIKVIGVIGAGVKGAFDLIDKNESCSIGVMATEGTVASNGYLNEINLQKEKLGYTGEIQVYQQPGVGLAGAIDGITDYIKTDAITTRNEYKGPSLKSEQAKIHLKILNRYNFDWNKNKILFSGERNNPTELQLNSIENYIYYNLVSLLEQIKNSPNAKPLKIIILGCTHYPYFADVFEKKLKELYELKENGNYVYRNIMYPEIKLIDPAKNTAIELYEYLKENDFFNDSSLDKSEFYISVPNVLNKNVQLDSLGNFTYDYKYGRNAGEFQEYVKAVPFSEKTLLPEVLEMIKEKIPFIFKLIME